MKLPDCISVIDNLGCSPPGSRQRDCRSGFGDRARAVAARNDDDED
jgi:hypothetical protein